MENITITNVAIMESIGPFSSVFNTVVPYSKAVNIPSISYPKHVENNLIKSPMMHLVRKPNSGGGLALLWKT